MLMAAAAHKWTMLRRSWQGTEGVFTPAAHLVRMRVSQGNGIDYITSAVKPITGGV